MRVRVALALAPALLALAVVPAGARSTTSVSLGRYIVVLRDGASVTPEQAAARVAGLGGLVSQVYSTALRGYAASLPQAALAAVLDSADVAYVEPDGVMHASATQTGATWGLDRVDQRNLPVSGTFSYTRTGAGVTAYVIDTGIRVSHGDFGGRARVGTDTVTPGGSAADCNGHGTHVAGTVGGTAYGVAKAVNLVAVRVLDCDGSGATSGIIAGVDWVTAHHQAGQPAVANMSLGGSASSALDSAVRNSIADGISYALAAGNGNFLGFAEDACNVSPARVAEAITVGATDNNDRKASFSNFGSCVDLFAPGVGITSDWMDHDSAIGTISGTSMASPHVAGVAALHLQGAPSATPKAVRDAVFAKATKGKVTNAGGGGLFGGSTPNNHLLFTDY